MFRLRRDKTLLRSAVAVVASTMFASPARAATEIGRADGAGSGPYGCPGVQSFVQSNTGPTSPSYSVPAGGGVIVSWKVEATVIDEVLKLKVFRPTPVTNEFTVVGESGFVGFPGPGILQFPTRIPVAAGDRLGFTVDSGPGNVFTGCFMAGTDPADVMRFASGDPAVGSTFTTAVSFTARTLNVAAIVEPDADRDGFGDESQDACLGRPGVTGGCPPQTRIMKHPKKRTEKDQAKFTFSSDQGDATFKCKLDRTRLKGCTSPYRKHAGPGTHKFLVEAIDAGGFPDPKPEKFRWIVLE